MCFLMYILFFFNDTATTEIYTLSLHDALPISGNESGGACVHRLRRGVGVHAAIHFDMDVEPELGDTVGDRLDLLELAGDEDRKSTRLNSSHANISYAVFCLKKKKTVIHNIYT